MFGKLIAGKKINYPQLFYLLSDFDKILMLLLVLMSYESLWCQGCISGQGRPARVYICICICIPEMPSGCGRAVLPRNAILVNQGLGAHRCRHFELSFVGIALWIKRWRISCVFRNSDLLRVTACHFFQVSILFYFFQLYFDMEKLLWGWRFDIFGNALIRTWGQIPPPN